MVGHPTAVEGLTFEPEEHVYRLNGRRVWSVTQVMSRAGLGPDYDEVPRETLEAKGRIGTFVHAVLHHELTGRDVDEVRWAEAQLQRDEALRADGYLRAGRRFVEEMDLRVEWSEQRYVSRRWLYAGTVDVVGWSPMLGATRGIFDWKTTATLHVEAVGAQTAGYRALHNECRAERPVQARWAVQLREDGTWRLEPLTDPADEARFMAAVRKVCDVEDPVTDPAACRAAG